MNLHGAQGCGSSRKWQRGNQSPPPACVPRGPPSFCCQTCCACDADSSSRQSVRVSKVGRDEQENLSAEHTSSRMSPCPMMLLLCDFMDWRALALLMGGDWAMMRGLVCQQPDDRLVHFLTGQVGSCISSANQGPTFGDSSRAELSRRASQHMATTSLSISCVCMEGCSCSDPCALDG